MAIFNFLKRKYPHIILLVLDGYRADRLDLSTVFEDLRKKGTLFSNMITYAPYTIGAIHALISGLYGSASGVNAYFRALNFDKENCFTLPQYLQEKGYRTKADLLSKITAPHQGFDEVLVQDENQTEFIDRHKKLVAELKSNSRPTFLYLHYSNIHTMLVKSIINKIDDFDKNYYSNLDENSRRYNFYASKAADYLKELLLEIERRGLFSNSLIIVLADHGCSIGEKFGEKIYGIYTYDYTIKVFAYFIYPQLFPRNKEISAVVRTVDVMPTILDILNISPKKNYKPLQGKSLMPVISGRDKEERFAFAETGGLGGPHPSTHRPNVKCIRLKDWKLIYNLTTGKKELYNLRDDKQETENLIGRFPEIEEDLWNKLTQFYADQS